MQLCGLRSEAETRLWRQRDRQPLLLIPRVFTEPPASSTTTTVTVHFRKLVKARTLERAIGKALAVVATDINNDDEWTFFVANDTVQKLLIR